VEVSDASVMKRAEVRATENCATREWRQKKKPRLQQAQSPLEATRKQAVVMQMAREKVSHDRCCRGYCRWPLNPQPLREQENWRRQCLHHRLSSLLLAVL